MSEINLEIKKIVENYLKYSNFTIYKIEKSKIITRKTIVNILNNSTSKISKKTIEKLLKLPSINTEDYSKLKKILLTFKTEKSPKNQSSVSEDFILKLLDKIIEKKILKNQNNINVDLYFENRKINSFNSVVGSRTLLGKKIWELNDDVFKKWGDTKLLLDITPSKDKNEMKKGLMSVAKNLRQIADELEMGAFNSKDLEEDTIINIKGE